MADQHRCAREIDQKNLPAQPYIVGERLYQGVDDAPSDEQPGGDDVRGRDLMRGDQQHHDRIEDHRQLELVGEIIGDARYVMRLLVPRKIAIDDLAALDGLHTRNREPDVEQKRPADLR